MNLIARSLFAFVPLLALGVNFAGVAAAQEMPLEVHARYWESPGPEQSEEGAPKLLIMYPVKEGDPTDEKVARYAGRVEPVDAEVTLNGEELKVWPGGVFTGLHAIQDEDKDFQEVWKFEAKAGGKATTVRRTVKLERPPAVPKAWPLTFFAAAVSPTGDYVVPEGKTQDVKLYGSPGAKAEYRIGEGAWQAMEAGNADSKRGAEYKAKLTPPVVDARGPQKVSFRLTAEHEGEQKTITKKSDLRVAMMAPAAAYAGEITQYVATYLKEPEGWDRWGNWIAGTRFPVVEVRGDRARTDFGQGGAESKGWLELIHCKIDWTSTGATGLADLQAKAENSNAPTNGSANVSGGGNSSPDDDLPGEYLWGQYKEKLQFIWSWNFLQSPIAAVFHYEPGITGGGKLTITLPGAEDSRTDESEAGSEIGKAKRVAKPGNAPLLAIDLKQALWGFGMGVSAKNGFHIDVRVAPNLTKATGEKPLTGMRIMLDAGHGGDDVGAIGPSGITEDDLNLVEAAWLEKYLTEMGATIKQLRREDVRVELDDRCKQAIAYDPDLFVSLHHNSVGFGSDPLYDSGPIVFFHYAHSKPLAEAIAGPLSAAFGSGGGLTGNGRVKPENFRVMRNFNLCPSVLVETAYVCNPEDDFKLRKTETVKKDARAIAEGIKSYVVGTQGK